YKRDDNKSQIKQLQQAFNEELSAQGIDPRRLTELKQKQDQLKHNIKAIEMRLDELTSWQNFMAVDWQQLRPELLAKETELKQQQRTVKQGLEQQKADYSVSQKKLDE